MLSDVIITRAEHMIHRQAVEYFGFSKHFDALMEGDRAPYYTAIITEDDVGLSIEWKRGE